MEASHLQITQEFFARAARMSGLGQSSQSWAEVPAMGAGAGQDSARTCYRAGSSRFSSHWRRRAWIWSRTLRKVSRQSSSEPVACEGSSKLQ